MKPKIIRVLKKIYSAIVTVIMIVSLVFVGTYICGIRPYAVISGSMQPAISVGSVCFVNTHAKYENIKKGDIITFKIGEKATATHRAHKITRNGIVTKGDANKSADNIKVTSKNFVGKVVLTVPKIGFFFESIKNPAVIVLIIAAILALTLVGIVWDRKE